MSENINGETEVNKKMETPQESIAWLSRGKRQRVRALKEALGRLQREIPEDRSAWLAEVADVLTLSLPTDSRILAEFEVARKIEDDTERTERVKALLSSTAAILTLQPSEGRSLIDDLALAAVGSEDAEAAHNAFEIKRALYSSFARSWPLRIVLILLLIAFGLVGWQVSKIAGLGIHARETVEAAQVELDRARKEMIIAQNQQQILVSKARLDAETAHNELEGVLKAQEQGRIDLLNAAQSAKSEIGNLTTSAREDLEILKSNAVTEFSRAQREVLGEMQRSLANKESDLAGQINKLAVQGKKAIESEIGLAKNDVIAVRTTADSFKETSQAEIQNVLTALRSDLEKFQLDQRTNAEGVLARNLVEQKLRLTNRTTNLVDSLNTWQSTGESEVAAVVDRVEAQENQWKQRNEQLFKQLEARIIKLGEKIGVVEASYSEHLRLSRQIASVADQVRKEARWIKPAWVAAVLEVRTGLVILAALMAILAAFITWRACK